MSWGWIFTNLMSLMGIGYGWVSPFFGLMIYTAFAILRPPWLWFWAWPGGDAPRFSLFVAISTMAGFMFKGMPTKGAIQHVKLPMYGLFLYLLSGLFAWKFTAVSSARAWDALDIQLKIGVMSFVALCLVRNAKQISIFAWILLLTLGYLAFEFNTQYLFDGWNRIYWNGFGGVDNNGVAMIMVMGVPLAFFLGINTKKISAKLVCFFSVACMVHVVLFSFSRGGQLGLCIVGATLFLIALFKLPNKILTIIIAIFFVWLALHLAGEEVRQRFWTIFADEGERDASAASRFDTWTGAWNCMKDHPFGVGPRNFNLISHRYGLPPNKSVHNLFLQTGADYGFLGLLGLFMFYGGTIIKTYAMASTSRAIDLGWPRYFGHMVCISLTGFMVCSTFIGMESVETGVMIALLGLATVSYVKSAPEATTQPHPERERERYDLTAPYLHPGAYPNGASMHQI